MNLKTFFDNFELLAEAPNGIKKLRELILQLAVMGKLAPQEPKDEAVSVLLDKIKFEKEQLAREGKIKKVEKLPLINLGEIPYQLPNTWCWVRLGYIISLMDAGWSPACKSYSTTDESKWGVLKTTAVQALEYKQEENKELPEELEPHLQYEVKAGDILITRAGPRNRVGICCLVKKTRRRLMISDKIIRFHLIDKYILSDFIVLSLNSGFSKSFIEIQKSGMAASQMNISQEKLKNTPIPIPPLAEQHRIIAKVDQLMKLCDELEARQQKKREARVTINNTAIAQLLTAREPEEFNKSWQRIYNNFDLLYSTPENIAKLRSCILQLAVMGKLAPQDPSDEPASTLLEKIKAEKKRLVEQGIIKKSGNLLDVSKSKLLHTLPKEWLYVSLGECVDLISGQHLNQDEQNDNEQGLPYLTGPSDFGKINPIVTRWTLTPKAIAEKNDILITVKGAGVGKTNILYIQKAAIGRQIMAIRPILLNTNYIYLLILASYQEFQSLATGSTVPGLSREDILNFILPLPPLNEQHRIVAKVNQLMTLCNQLEAQLKQSLADSQKLMEAVVRQMLDVNTIAADDISAEPSKLETKTVKQSRNKTLSYDGEAVQLNLPLF